MTSTNFTVNSDRLDPVLLHDYVQASLVESPFIRAGGCPEQLGAPGTSEVAPCAARVRASLRRLGILAGIVDGELMGTLNETVKSRFVGMRPCTRLVLNVRL